MKTSTNNIPHTLLGMYRSEIQGVVMQAGEKKFRGKQIADWVYKHGAASYAEMTNIPLAMREYLEGNIPLGRSKIIGEKKASDGTAKYLLELTDSENIECVLLPYKDRVSVCVSSQVGCSAGCEFCATAQGGFARNLGAGEIVDQVLTCRGMSKHRISHVVLMGMGEPLFNLQNVLKAIRLINIELEISMRSITLSTIGVPAKIDELAERDLQLTLAVSLHAPNDNIRSILVPLAKNYSVEDIVESSRNYAEKTRRRVTFEYMMVEGVNDRPEHAMELAKLLRGVMGHVNLIPYNEVPGLAFRRPRNETIKEFLGVLESSGLEVTQRLARGAELDAACGQLKRQNTPK